MASDDEDEELKALRLAVLLSMKNKVAKEPYPKPDDEDELKSLREAALATKKQHVIESHIQTSSPWQQSASNSPNYARPPFPVNQSYSTDLPFCANQPFPANPPFSTNPQFSTGYQNFNNQPSAGLRGRPRASNLIVINPEPMGEREKTAVTTVMSEGTKVLIRPQDKWCSPNRVPKINEEPKKTKVSSKFSRYDSSGSDSSDISSDSDSEDKKTESTKNKSDSISDSDSDDIEKQIDALLNSPKRETENEKSHKIGQEAKSKPEEQTVKSQSEEKEKLSKRGNSIGMKTESGKLEVKPIPTLIRGSKTMGKKKISNAWSDSDSDSGVRSGQIHQKPKVKRSWSDQGSSDDEKKNLLKSDGTKNQMTKQISSAKVADVSKGKSETEKEERRRAIENDLQKTLKALQSIKEKRLKQEATKKNTVSDKTSVERTKESKAHSPKSKQRSPSRKSPCRRSSPSRKSSPRRSPYQKPSYSPCRSSRRRSLSPISRRSSAARRKQTSGYKRSTSRSPIRCREKPVLNSEERTKIEARRKKFENSNAVAELKKTVSLKNVMRRSNSNDGSLFPPQFNIKGPKDRQVKTPVQRKSRESKENKDEQESERSHSSVSSLSDSDSDDEGRSWRKEQNQNKHLMTRKPINTKDNIVRNRKDKSSLVPIDRERKNIEKSENRKSKKTKFAQETVKSVGHIYSDNVDRGFDASNYRKTKVDSGVASTGSDSDEKSTKNKKLFSVVLPSDSKKDSPTAPTVISPVRKVERSEKRNRFQSERGKRVVTTEDEVPRTKKPKLEKVEDARRLLQAIKQQNENPRKAVFRKDGISITLPDKNISDQESPPKPSVHDRLGRKLPSLLSIRTEDLASRFSTRTRSPEYSDFKKVVKSSSKDIDLSSRISSRVRSPEYSDFKVVKTSSKDIDLSSRISSRVRSPEYSDFKVVKTSSKDMDVPDSKRSKSKGLKRSNGSEKKVKKKRSVIHYDSPDDDDDNNALEKRIKIIKEKNAAILKRQAEIQKDKERFG